MFFISKKLRAANEDPTSMTTQASKLHQCLCDIGFDELKSKLSSEDKDSAEKNKKLLQETYDKSSELLKGLVNFHFSFK